MIIFVGMTLGKYKPVTVGFISLGCPKNMVDSERMLAEIAQAGFLITAEPDNADVVVINTCGFIAPARDEALKAIRDAVDCKLRGAVKKVVVAGCLCERLGPDLFNQADGIDAMLDLGQRDLIAQIIQKTIHTDEKKAYLSHQPQKFGDEASEDKKEHLGIFDDRGRLLISPGHWAYLRISEGCDRRCSFCTIPSIRGPFRSKPRELILAEAAELVSAGVVELNIIAQDTTSWGRDLKIKEGLSSLVKEIEKITDLVWIRLMYLYPAGITDQLIDTIVKSEKIVHYIDIPIQHINDEILKSMHRPDTGQGIFRLIENLRKTLPDIVLRTTMMVGFPCETDRQFDELIEFVKWAKFDALGCFTFFSEAGTSAADMANQVPEEIKQQRLEKLMLTQQTIAFAKNKNRLGTKITCLVDSVDYKRIGRGRFYGQAPDIDSVCLIKDCSARPGRFVNTKVVGTDNYDLIVEQI